MEKRKLFCFLLCKGKIENANEVFCVFLIPLEKKKNGNVQNCICHVVLAHPALCSSPRRLHYMYKPAKGGVKLSQRDSQPGLCCWCKTCKLLAEILVELKTAYSFWGKKSNIKFAIEVDKWRNLASSCFLCSCVFVTWSFCFYLQNVYVRVPGGTGIPAALRDVPGPGLEDGMCSSSLAFLFLSKDILSAY